MVSPVSHRRGPVVAGAVAGALSLAGCGGATRPSSPAIKRLVSQARPIGAGPRFEPAVTGQPIGACRRRLGRRLAAHIEVFARDRVVIIPAGIGLQGARTLDGRVIRARCYGRVVTLDPTGVVLVSRVPTARLADLFSAWGLPISRVALAGFRAGASQPVRVYVNGRRVTESPGDVAIARHAEIVLEVGPYVPPHSGYAFPVG